MQEITTTEVDGVRTVWAPCDGPLHARLIFRVGTADETLPTSGRTHLLEHLALFGIEDPALHHNGAVDQTTTVFHTSGDPDAVTGFLSHVTAALHDLPVWRLEQEKAVLAVEAERRTPWVGEPLLVWRFGAMRHGLVGQPPYGVRGAAADDLRAWAGDRFTAANAVLVLTGPPPQGLRLTLPAGTLVPTPPVVRQFDRLPAWFRHDLPGVAASAVLTRSNEATVLAATAEHLMRERLRTRQALTYSPQAYYQRLDAVRTHVVLFADGAREGLAALTDAFGQLVRDLAVPQPQAVATIVGAMLKEYRQARSRPDVAAIMDLTSIADDLLHGRPHKGWQQIEAELEATDPARVADMGRDFQRDALFELPHVEANTALFGTAAPLCTVETPAGQAYQHRDAPIVTSHLVVGPYGAATWQRQQLQGAVRFDRLAATTRWADGGLTLIGQDATHLRVEPTLWHDGAAARDKILARVDPALIIDLGERPADSVPLPSSTRWQRFATRVTRAAKPTRYMWQLALGIALVLLYVIGSLLARRPLPVLGLVLGLVMIRAIGLVREDR